MAGSVRSSLLEDHQRAERLGREAHRRVAQDYFAPRRLTQECESAPIEPKQTFLYALARGRRSSLRLPPAGLIKSTLPADNPDNDRSHLID